MIRRTLTPRQKYIFRRLSTAVSHHIPSASLDLDFVLGLLDSSANKSVVNNDNQSTSWSRMKFKVIETADTNELKEAKLNFDDYSSFFAPLNASSTSSSSTSTFDRLQSLADSLPTQIYDKNGNLMPLNSHNPPMSFFEMNTGIKTSANLMESVKTVPIFEREGVDWSQVSLTSILKKIVPEEAFLEHNEEKVLKCDATKDSSGTAATTTATTTIKTEFTMAELKLLDKDQLHSLAKYLNIKITKQTDHKLEQEIFSICNNIDLSQRQKRVLKPVLNKEKISWTEENESLLIKLYEELRSEKQKVDQKLINLVSPNTSIVAMSLKTRVSERGFWAVLAEQMRNASKIHVSLSECRNKLMILKRLRH